MKLTALSVPKIASVEPFFFPSIIDKLRNLGKSNPHDEGYGFIFWGKTPEKTLDHKIFLKFFRRALERAGLAHDVAEKYTFHSCFTLLTWRTV